MLRVKLSKLLSGDDMKAIQKIVIAIGHICVKETSTSRLNLALDLIISLCRSKVGRLLFSIFVWIYLFHSFLASACFFSLIIQFQWKLFIIKKPASFIHSFVACTDIVRSVFACLN